MILLSLILAAAIGATGTLALVITFVAGWTLAKAGLPSAATAISATASPPSPTTSDRIILADLRERMRQLEAIAAGIDP